MHQHEPGNRRASAQALDADFKRRARQASGAAAERLLARGRSVSYRDHDTPAGHVMRRHPDGRIETVRIELVRPAASTGRRSA